MFQFSAAAIDGQAALQCKELFGVSLDELENEWVNWHSNEPKSRSQERLIVSQSALPEEKAAATSWDLFSWIIAHLWKSHPTSIFVVSDLL